MMTKKWKCALCDYLHEGDTPPHRCPACGAPKDMFAQIKSKPPE